MQNSRYGNIQFKKENLYKAIYTAHDISLWKLQGESYM